MKRALKLIANAFARRRRSPLSSRIGSPLRRRQRALIFRRAGLLAIGLTTFCFGVDAQPAAKAAARIDVSVLDFRNTQGQLGCLLFSSPRGFPDNPRAAVGMRMAPIFGATGKCKFTGLPAGKYAVFVMHDENGNGELDHSFIGEASEGFGVSNNKTRDLGPPTWEDSAFSLDEGEAKSISVHLKY